MGTMASQITSLSIVYSIVYSDADQKKIKATRHWPLCGEFTGDRGIPRTNGQLRGKCFHLMTSSCPMWFIITGASCPAGRHPPYSMGIFANFGKQGRLNRNNLCFTFITAGWFWSFGVRGQYRYMYRETICLMKFLKTDIQTLINPSKQNEAGNYVINGLDYGLSPDQCQAIIYTYPRILLIGYLGTSEWSTILLIRVRLISQIWRYCIIHNNVHVLISANLVVR